MPAEGQNKEKRTLGSRYRMEKRLGSGNFGTAYLITDIKEKNELKVLKQIPIGELLPDETVDAMSEARLLSRLKHPNIVKFHDSFLDGEHFCIVTEYCEGGDLDQRVTQAKKEGKTFDEKQVMDWFTQLLLAVQYMHKRRVLHRDLKARNIFLRNNMVKIGDFGISKILMGTSDMASTFTGTPYYMSPEVLKHEGYNSKSDVWSVGCILYELCNLEHAFEGKGLMGVMFKVVEGDLPKLPSRYSPELNDILQMIFQRDVNKRPDAFVLTQHPFIVDHIQRMTAELSGNDLASPDMTIAATADSAHLAQLLSTKTRLGDLQREEEERYRGLTARERLRLKKQQEADSKARVLNEAAKNNLAENQMRKTMLVREKTAIGGAPWVHGSRPPDGASTYRQQMMATMPPRRPHMLEDDDDDDDDDDGGTVLQTVKNHRDYKPPIPPQHQHGLLRQQQRSSVGDDRPITPLKDKMVFNVKNSSLDFAGGVPDDPSVANTYYSQFYDEFEDEEEDAAAAQTVIRRPPQPQNGGDFRGIAHAMQKGLNEGPPSTLRDDMLAGAFGPHAKQVKMENMRAKSIQLMGEDKFREVYDYVKHARLEKREEDQIIAGVKQLDAHPDGCFYVDQLLFLEMN